VCRDWYQVYMRCVLMLNIEHVCGTYMPISKTMVIGGVVEGPAVESCFILHTDWILCCNGGA
jgi:hypothetical protein